MRGNNNKHLYLVHFEHPPKVIKTTTECITFFSNEDGLHVDKLHGVPNKDEAFTLCTLDFDPSKGEKAVILKINILHTHNEFEEAFFWEAVLREQTKEDEEEHSNHPDNTGKVCVVIPGNEFKGFIPQEERLVYEPKLVHLDIPILPFIGIEGHLLNARSTCITSQGIDHEYQAFNQTDPLLVFLLEHKHHFDEVNAHDIKKAGERIYLVKRHLVKRIQIFFKNSICALIKYVSYPVIEFKWKSKPPQKKGFVSAIVQIDYVVLSPEVIRYKTSGIKLDV